MVAIWNAEEVNNLEVKLNVAVMIYLVIIMIITLTLQLIIGSCFKLSLILHILTNFS